MQVQQVPDTIYGIWPSRDRAYKERLLSDIYTVTVNGSPCPAYFARVSAAPFNRVWPGRQRPLAQSEAAAYICFTSDEPVTVAVRGEGFSAPVVRPLSAGAAVTERNGVASFRLDKPGQYVFEPYGEHRALHIFFNPPDEFPEKEQAAHYFGPGIHFPGKITVRSGETVYIDRDAVVYGAIYGRNVENVRIVGYGVLDGSWEERLTEHCYEDYTNGCVKFYDSTGIEIRGVILKDSALWVTNLFHCRDVRIDNIKIVGQWRYNSDGIDIVNSSRVRVTRSFIRSFDDAITLKGIAPYAAYDCSDITVADCVIWCDWGRSLEVGLETACAGMERIRFSGCRIIHSSSAVLDIQAGDYAAIDDVCFEDAEVEYQPYMRPPLIETESLSAYPADPPSYRPALISVTNPPYTCYFGGDFRSSGDRPGSVGRVRFTDIRVLSPEPDFRPTVTIVCRPERGSFRDIRIANVSVNGRPVTAADADITVSGTDGVRFDGRRVGNDG